MVRFTRRCLADWLLTSHERDQAERDMFRRPFVRAWLRRELWTPAVTELFGRFPPGHPHRQDNPIVRFYPLAMLIIAVAWVLMGLL